MRCHGSENKLHRPSPVSNHPQRSAGDLAQDDHRSSDIRQRSYFDSHSPRCRRIVYSEIALQRSSQLNAATLLETHRRRLVRRISTMRPSR
jgi:hypothetical protein